MPDLAKLRVEPSAERGLDVVHAIKIPDAWTRSDVSFEFDVPRRLRCAACKGGGCDACGRRGAVAVHGPGAEPETVSVRLNRGTSLPCALRLLDQGAPAENAELPRGCLILEIDAGPPSAGLRRHKASPIGALPRGVWLGVAIALLVVVALRWFG